MPSRRGPVAATRASKAKSRTAKKDPADIYDDLIAEATSETDFASHDERPLKKRKANPRTKLDVEPATPSKGKEPQYAASNTNSVPTSDAGNLQDDASDSDLAFEDVEFDNGSINDDSDEDLEDVNISLGQQTEATGSGSSSRRKPINRAEKQLRIIGHKAHLAALVGHCMIVNSRCNDRRLHKILKPMLNATTRSYLRPSKDHTQFQQDRTFNIGLERAMESFKDAYHVTAAGMRRARWQDEQHETLVEDTDVLGRKDFINAARQMSGSQDTGNQLFCAMLRAAGVRARLVCSLQVLPIANTKAAPITPSKPAKPVVFAIAPDTPLDKPDERNLSLREKAIASARSRIGRPAFQNQQPAVQRPKTKSFTKLVYPIFWTEVLSMAYQKWVPVDPVVTQTMGKASKLEPPLSYPHNQLVYAIAFSENGSAKDVTRRYTKAFNAKTRRMRLESVGEADSLWYAKLLRVFANTRPDDTDAIEDTELVQRTARERLPGNIQDFKGHPVYALERHIKRHEVLHPRREAGKVNAGTAANPKMESIFRREDVHVCRSADQWYRHGRVVKAGEQALKLVLARTRRDSDDEAEHTENTALYILSQTELYIPKPVVRGRVPQNAFGNLDIYVPSMIPPGGAHIRHPLAKAAAEVLHIDAVEAVTGWKFAGRKGTKVVEGAVIPEQHVAAIHAVIEGLLWQEVDERSRARSALALRMWKRLLQGLKIAERVASYATEAVEKQDDISDMPNTTAWYADEDVPLHTAGKYTLDDLIDMAKESKKPPKRKKLSDSEDDLDDRSDSEWQGDADDMGGGFMPESSAHQDHTASDLGGGFMPESPAIKHPAVSDDMEGEFLPQDAGHDVPEGQSEADYGGGFVVDDEMAGTEHEIMISQQDASAPVEHTFDPGTARSTLLEPRHAASGNVDSYSTSDSELPRRDVPEKHNDNADADSLLSHDPEDEDAEPDWMESD